MGRVGLLAQQQSRLPLKAKVFILRVMVGELPLREALQRESIVSQMCLFCTNLEEHCQY